MTITLKEVAKLAGVSLATASRVINDYPGVRPQTRERVKQVIKESGYQPNQTARNLASKRIPKNKNPVS